jgi:hypothetical protein
VKNATIGFCLLLILILVGCTNSKSLLFTGQSVHWKGDYTANINGNNEDGVFTIRYKNGGSPTFKNLEVEVQDKDGHVIQKDPTYKGSKIKISKFGTGIKTTNENSIFKVTVKWNNNYQETFSLKPSKYK